MVQRARLVAADVSTEDSLALSRDVRAAPRTAEEPAEQFRITQVHTVIDAEVQSGIAAPEDGDNPRNAHVARNIADSRTDQDRSLTFLPRWMWRAGYTVK